MDLLRTDLRHALRTLWLRPATTLTVVLTLALGIGVNTAIFSFVKAILVDALPFPAAGHLVMVYQDQRGRGGPEREWLSWLNFRDFREGAESLEDLAAFTDAPLTLAGAGEAERLAGVLVSPSMLRVLGVEPILGRGLREAEGRPGAPRVALLSYGLWQRRFAGDRSVVGRSLALDGQPTTVVGILPRSFRMPFVPGFEVLAPLDPTGPLFAARGAVFLRAIGRLAPGTSLAASRADLATVAGRLAGEHPSENRGISAALFPLRDELVGAARPALLVLLAAVGLVLLVACANVANLLLARASGRRGEMALRAALGADRGRLLRQVLGESLLLSLGAGVFAALAAPFGVDALKLLLSATRMPLPRIDEVAVDGGVLAFTLAVAVGTGLLAGLAPALAASRGGLEAALREGGGTAGERPAGSRLRAALVVAECALSALLLVGAGLLLRSFEHLRRVDPGFDARGLLTASLSLPPAAYADRHRAADLVRRFSADLAALPGVGEVAAVSALPLTDDNNTDIDLRIEGEPPPESGQRAAWYRQVTPGYFRTAGVRLLHGRVIDAGDRDGAPRVAVVNETLVRRYLAGRDPLGRTLLVGTKTRLTIVGVVADVHSFSLTTEEPPALYLAEDQFPTLNLSFVLRTTADAADLAGPARAALSHLDPTLALVGPRPLAEVLASALGPDRALSLLVAFTGGLALVLAALGLYGVMAYTVAQRRREIGIRMALGADAGSVRTLVLQRAARLTALGLGLGLIAAAGLARLLGSLLFGLGPLDPASFAAAAVTLAAAALLAGYLPARSAAGLDPAAILRG